MSVCKSKAAESLQTYSLISQAFDQRTRPKEGLPSNGHKLRPPEPQSLSSVWQTRPVEYEGQGTAPTLDLCTQ